VIFIAVIWLFLRTGILKELTDSNELDIINTRRYINFKENENMYLVGNLSFRSLFDKRAKFRHDINETDMAKAKNDPDYQIIDLANKTYYDPSNEQWIEMPSEWLKRLSYGADITQGG